MKPDSIGKRLRALREQRGLTIRSLASKAAAGRAGSGGDAMTLTADHLHALHVERSIALEVITERGYHSAPQPADLIDRTFSKPQAKLAPALVIPIWDVHGQRAGWQMR